MSDPSRGPTRAALSVGEVLQGGGWDARYAIVRVLASTGDFAFSITDGNGDRRELETEYWTFQDGRWVSGSSVGGTFHTRGDAETQLDHDWVTIRYEMDDGDERPDPAVTHVGRVEIRRGAHL